MRAALALAAVLLAACGGGAASTRRGTPMRRLPPANPQAVNQFQAGARLLGKGPAQHDKAMARFRKAVEIDPNLWEAHYDLGYLHEYDGDLALAAKSYRAALKIQPGYRPTVVRLGAVLSRAGDPEAAQGVYEDYLEANPDAIEVRVGLVGILRARREWSDALAEARKVLVRDGRNIQALNHVGMIYFEQERWEIAELVFKKALDLAPGDASILVNLGLVALARGDNQAAFAYFARATEADPQNPAARMNKASVLLECGNFAEAEGDIRSVIQSNAQDTGAWNALGVALRGQSRHGEAKAAWERVLEIRPNHAGALFNLGRLHVDFLQEPREGATYLRRYLEVAPSGAPDRAAAEELLQVAGGS
jgi:tetratricopeptide (TPR) repeat protein